MNPFLAFVFVGYGRNKKRASMAGFLAALIALLLYETRWLGLRPGLFVLLSGQLGDVLALLARNIQLSNDLSQRVENMNETSYSTWFEREEQFVKRLALFDTACQMVGFLMLGYAVWMATQTVWLAVAIGVVYPVTLYLGITRRKNQEAIRQIRATREEVLLNCHR